VKRDISLIELRQRQVARAGDVLAGAFIGFADIDQDGALIKQALRPLGRDSWKGHFLLLL